MKNHLALLITAITTMTTTLYPEPGNSKLQKNLHRHVSFLTELRPFRHNENTGSLNKAAAYIEKQFQNFHLEVSLQKFKADGRTYQNVIAIYGDPALPKVVVGAHYDACGDQPGADDNASGVAGLIELARMVSQNKPFLKYHIEFVAYSLEEPPHFRTETMGSYVHAKSLHDQNANVKLMIALEMIGYFTEQEESQQFPVSFLKYIYPTTGNFIAVVGRFADFRYLRKTKKEMTRASSIGVESLAAPTFLAGIDFSDHLNYWAHGYHALMITDTAFYRNNNYHQVTDTIDTLDFEKMAEVVKGLYGAITKL